MVGDRILELRKRAGLTQSELADRLDLSQSRIGQWENGYDDVPESRKPDLARALGVTVAELTEGYVSSPSDVFEWRNTVLRDQELRQSTRTILSLLPLPGLLQADIWAVTVTIEALAGVSGLSEGFISQHWDEVLESPYVDRIGENEWTLRLCLPDDK